MFFSKKFKKDLTYPLIGDIIRVQVYRSIIMDHKLSNQAVGAIMMALQKSLLEQSDITPVLRNFQIQVDDAGQLVVMNPPTVEVKDSMKVDKDA